MIVNGNPPPLGVRGPGVRLAAQFKRYSGLLLLALLVASARAQRPEEAFLKIIVAVDQADSFSERAQTNAALAKYQEAHKALADLKKEHPAWNAKPVAFRLNYLAERITALSSRAPAWVAPEASPATLAAGMSLKLLGAGAEPRKVLRMQPKPGAKETGMITAKSSMGMGATGAPSAVMKLPAMKMTVGVLPKSVTDEGDINYEVTIEEVDVAVEADTMPGTAEAMKASLNRMKGLVVSCTMSDRGVKKQVEARIPSDADAETRAGIEAMKDSLADSDFVLPHEAIGAGARWEVKQKIKTGRMTIDQTTTFQLVAVEGDVLTVNSFAAQRAANQKIPNPMLPQTMAELVKLTGNLTNTATFNLAKLLPAQQTSEEHTETTVATTPGDQKQTITIKSVANTSVESK